MDLPFGKFHGSFTADVWPGYGCFPQIFWMCIQIETWMPTNILGILSHSDPHSLENHSFLYVDHLELGHLPWQTAGHFQKLTFAGHEPAMITRSATSKQPPGSARGNGQVHQGTECREMRLRLPWDVRAGPLG